MAINTLEGVRPLNVVALGWALSLALVALFVVSLVVALLFPDLGASHAWVGLFSAAPLDSFRVWIEGIIFSVVFGWITAGVFGTVYNRLIER
jgi:hypothetical protein